MSVLSESLVLAGAVTLLVELVALVALAAVLEDALAAAFAKKPWSFVKSDCAAVRSPDLMSLASCWKRLRGDCGFGVSG